MATYRVKDGQRVHHGKGETPARIYEEGELVELSTAEAAQMPWAVEPVAKKGDKLEVPPAK